MPEQFPPDIPTNGTKGRILVVDYEADIREILCMALEGEGYAVDAVAGVTDAKSRLADIQYALVLTDWRLPDGDGLVIANWAKELGSKSSFLCRSAIIRSQKR